MENPIPWTDSLGREGEGGRGGEGRGGEGRGGEGRGGEGRGGEGRGGEGRGGEGRKERGVSGRVRRRENVRVKKSKGGKWRAKVRGVSKSGGE